MSVLRPFVIAASSEEAARKLVAFFKVKESLVFFNTNDNEYFHIGAFLSKNWIPKAENTEEPSDLEDLTPAITESLLLAMKNNESTLGESPFHVGNLVIEYGDYEYIFENLTEEDENLQTPYIVEGRVIAIKKKDDETWSKIEPAPSVYLFRPIVEGSVRDAPEKIAFTEIDASQLNAIKTNNFHDILSVAGQEEDSGLPPDVGVASTPASPPAESPPDAADGTVWDAVMNNTPKTTTVGISKDRPPKIAPWERLDPNPFPMLQNDWLFNAASHGSTEVLFWGVPIRARVIRSLHWILAQKFPMLIEAFNHPLSAKGPRGIVVYFQYDEKNEFKFLAPFGGDRVPVTDEIQEGMRTKLAVKQKGKMLRMDTGQMYITAVRSTGGRLYPMWVAVIDNQ